MKRVRIKLTGRVQGVNFRKSAEEKAKYFGVAGYVRNLTDGSLLLEAEGDQSQVEEMISWARMGPVGAQVIKAEEFDVPPLGGSKFNVRY